MKPIGRRFIPMLVGMILLQLFAGLFSFNILPVARAETLSTRQIIFKPKDSKAVADIVKKYSLSQIITVIGSYVLVQVPDMVDANILSKIMSLDSSILVASANNEVTFMEAANRFNFDFTEIGGIASPATLATQWAWTKTNLIRAQKNATGKNVKVALLDTGVDYKHPMLAGKVQKGYDAVNRVADGNDFNGHGTFVAGVITQVAPNVQIIPVRVLDNTGIGKLDSVMRGFLYAMESGAQIINLSFHTDTDMVALHDLIIQANNRGILVVASSGNDNTGILNYPAAYEETVAVSATTKTDCRADFANYGSYIDISSPGVNIVSTWQNGNYAVGSGTSFSAPIVTGASAMVLEKNPGASPANIKKNLSKAIARFPTSCSCTGMGTGRLDFSKIKY